MLQRLYVHNFRCLQNFEIKPSDNSSLLFIGKNGRGKSTIAKVLSIFKDLGIGLSRLGFLITKEDFTLDRTNEQIRFEIDVLLDKKVYSYRLSLDMPEGFRELRIVEEQLTCNGISVFERKEAQVTYHITTEKISEFSLDWHSTALTMINEIKAGPITLLRNWLKNMFIMAPIPQQMKGESHGSFESLVSTGENFSDFLTSLITTHPESYSIIEKCIKQFMPDFRKFENKLITSDTRLLEVYFGDNDTSYKAKFDQLSEGEKCMFLGATVLAAQEVMSDVFIFWDEPDNYLAISEVQNFVLSLRRTFNQSGQLWITSHNSEAMNCFSHENTMLLLRKNHCSPVELRLINELISSKESTVRKFSLNELDEL